jgi:O-antigen/teichoic acid export membrane protein
MPVEQYAQFGVAFAFQSTVAMLADLGFTSSIIALAGERAKDPEIMGLYIRSAKHYRRILVITVGLGFAFLFPWIVSGQSWSPEAKVSILLSILCAVIVQGWSMYQAPLLSHRMVGQVYQPQILSAAVRLGLSGLAHYFQMLTGVVASWLGAFSLAYSGWFIKRNAFELVNEPEKSDPTANREMLRYTAPLLPGIVFLALQSQISMALITIFGSTQNVAEVAALGRLGQLFGILAAFNTMLIGPYFAQLTEKDFKRRYPQVAIIGILISLPVVGCGFLFPEIFLMLLGKNYQQLGSCIGWLLLTSSLGYIGSLFWAMHAARKWVFWRATFAYIITTLVIQTLLVNILDLSRTIGVIQFGLWTVVAGYASHLVAALIGFKQAKDDPA